MEYVIGVALALGVGAFATLTRWDRDRSFYPVVLVVVAAYYELFAAIDGNEGVLGAESMGFICFFGFSVLGFRTNLWIVAAALLGHGLFDFVHGHLIANAGVPAWWPMFCLSYDAVAAAYLAWLLLSGRLNAQAPQDRDDPMSSQENRGARLDLSSNAHRIGAIALTVGLLLTTASCASAPHDVQFATINGHRVAYRVLGAGSPAVVMISGLGEGMATFDDVAADLANTTTVIVYDRAGYGDSEPVDGARDARAAADELAALLPQTRIEGPYILLGHSLGGLYAEYYAAEYPDQVSGLILEDSRPADFTRRCEAARISICAPPTALGAFMPKGAQAEMRALPNISAEVERATPMSGKPVLVLSRPLAAKAKGFDALWSTNQASLAARYSGAQHLTAPGGGHGIHRDQKEWFVKATTSFVEANRPPT